MERKGEMERAEGGLGGRVRERMERVMEIGW